MRIRAAPFLFLLIGLALSGLVGQVVDHAYLVTVAIAAAIIVGLLLPVVTAWFVSARVTTAVCRARVGEPLAVVVETRNRLFLPIPVWLEFSEARLGSPRSLLAMPGTGVQRLELAPARRGDAELERTMIRSDFPFGLAVAWRPVGAGSGLLIWPRTIAAELPSSDSSAPAYMDSGSIDERGDGDPVGVRAYRRGDAMRLIHWKQSARHDQLIARERERARRQTTTVVLDTKADHYRDPQDFERAVSIAGGMLEAAISRRRRIVLLAGQDRIEISGDKDRDAGFDLLARVELQQTGTPIPPRGSVLITSQSGEGPTRRAGLHVVFVEDRFAGAAS